MVKTTPVQNKELVLKRSKRFSISGHKAAEQYWSSNYIQHSAHIPPGARRPCSILIRIMPASLKYEPNRSLLEAITCSSMAGFRNRKAQKLDCRRFVRVADGMLRGTLGCVWRMISDQSRVSKRSADVRDDISSRRE